MTLSFDGKTERLIVPFAAIGSFVDPSVQFGLQFPDMQASQASGAAAEAPTAALAKPADESPPTPTPAPVDAGDRVVALDSFRKK
ncbi:MAG: hypothetical protein HY057_09255 [Rhodospirillales bacterium]|nr:hypothetical protein [Rhodospirillales bacterium]